MCAASAAIGKITLHGLPEDECEAFLKLVER
jgi:hypothetical protein